MALTTKQSNSPAVTGFTSIGDRPSGSLVLEVPQPSEPVTPVVPDAPVTPIDPDPGGPAVPDEPATPAVPDPGPEVPEPDSAAVG
jgi:hypothetical protein